MSLAMAMHAQADCIAALALARIHKVDSVGLTPCMRSITNKL